MRVKPRPCTKIGWFGVATRLEPLLNRARMTGAFLRVMPALSTRRYPARVSTSSLVVTRSIGTGPRRVVTIVPAMKQ